MICAPPWTPPTGRPLSRLPLLLAALLLPLVSAAAQVYKWVDEQGQIHFSQTPPEQIQAEVVELPRNPPPAKERLEQLKKRAEEPLKRAAEQKKKRQQEEERARELEAFCEQQRKELEGLLNAQRIYVTDAQGNRIRAPEEERQARIRKVRESLAEHCE